MCMKLISLSGLIVMRDEKIFLASNCNGKEYIIKIRKFLGDFVAFLKRDKRICGILFDLDDTLCDYRAAARNARLIIYEHIKERFQI